MSHEIYIPFHQLELEFEDLIDYMTLNYHNTRYNTPSNIPDYHMTDEEQAEEDSLKFMGGGWRGCL